MPLTVEHGLQNIVTGLIVQAREKKSKLGSEALERDDGIQTNCKVSMRSAGVLHCNKWQPTSGQCMSVREDTAKSQSWTTRFGFFFPLVVM